MIKEVMAAAFIVAFFFTGAGETFANEALRDHFSNSQIGHPAPDFHLKTLDGDTVKLSDFRDKKVLLNFWATWCPSCKEGIPALNQFSKEAEQSVKIMTVNIDPSSDVARFVKEKNIVLPVLLDKKGEVTTAYGVTAVPTTYFIDEQGMVTQKVLGPISILKLREYMNKM